VSGFAVLSSAQLRCAGLNYATLGTLLCLGPLRWAKLSLALNFASLRSTKLGFARLGFTLLSRASLGRARLWTLLCDAILGSAVPHGAPPCFELCSAPISSAMLRKTRLGFELRREFCDFKPAKFWTPASYPAVSPSTLQ